MNKEKRRLYKIKEMKRDGLSYVERGNKISEMKIEMNKRFFKPEEKSTIVIDKSGIPSVIKPKEETSITAGSEKRDANFIVSPTSETKKSRIGNIINLIIKTILKYVNSIKRFKK